MPARRLKGAHLPLTPFLPLSDIFVVRWCMEGGRPDGGGREGDGGGTKQLWARIFFRWDGGCHGSAAELRMP